MKGKAMNQDLTTNAERLHGLKNRPHIVRSFFWRRSVHAVSIQQIRDAAWQGTLDLREARLLGAALMLFALASVGTAWLFKLLGWIR